MTRFRVNCFGVSADGYGAGPEQSLEHPLGKGGRQLMDWAMPTRTFSRMFGQEGGSTGADEAFAARSMAGVGAWIMGRNMFGPKPRNGGPWRDDGWKGWWGANPPYHVPVFVLTRHARAPLEMEGGTVFHFVTGGIHEALERARAAAGTLDIRLGGGVTTLRQYLEARLIDELHVAVAPVLLGWGESLWTGIDLPALGYRRSESVLGEGALHLVYTR
jgi:dihydrofolate reductase